MAERHRGVLRGVPEDVRLGDVAGAAEDEGRSGPAADITTIFSRSGTGILAEQGLIGAPVTVAVPISRGSAPNAEGH